MPDTYGKNFVLPEFFRKIVESENFFLIFR